MGIYYEQQLEAKINRQKKEITRLLAENQKLKGLNDTIYEETAEKARAEGQEEAWKLAQKLVLYERDGEFSIDELEEIFETQYWTDVFLLTYSEVAAKVAEWEQKKEEICVGDVLLSNRIGTKCIVTHTNNETVTTLWDDNSYGDRSKNFIKEELEKIGHIDIASLLAQIGDENDE